MKICLRNAYESVKWNIYHKFYSSSLKLISFNLFYIESSNMLFDLPHKIQSDNCRWSFRPWGIMNEQSSPYHFIYFQVLFTTSVMIEPIQQQRFEDLYEPSLHKAVDAIQNFQIFGFNALVLYVWYGFVQRIRRLERSTLDSLLWVIAAILLIFA